MSIQMLSSRCWLVALIAVVSMVTLAPPSFADSSEAPEEEIVPMAEQVPPPPPGPRPAPVQIPSTQPGGQPPAAPSAGTITQGLWLWQRTEYGDGRIVVAADPSKYTLAFLADGRLSIQADCNSGSGSYTLAGLQLTLRLGPMTLAACPPGSQDTVFVRDLGQVVTHVFAGENLVLNMRLDSGNLVFSPQPPASLAGATWHVQSYNNGRGGVVSVLRETQLSATFGENGSVSGDTGCNTYRGPYTVAGTSIMVGELVTTRRACLSDAATAQERAFLAALKASASYTLVGDRLTFLDAAGTRQVVFVKHLASSHANWGAS